MSFKAVPGNNWTSGVTTDITDTTQTTVIAAITGARINVTNMHIQNSHAGTATWVLVKCGSTTMWQVYCAASGGGAAPEFVIPLRGTSGAAWTVTCVTTGANVRASLAGFMEHV
jgi:hypothetical protein